MPDIFTLEPTTNIPTDSSYIVSYPYLRNFFAGKARFEVEDIVCGAHMVYGWMPTALDLYSNPPNISLQAGADLLTKAKIQGSLLEGEIEILASLVNNSVVGASKLLHFALPTSFAIWDSNIYAFIFQEKAHHYRVNCASPYKSYLGQLELYRLDARFPQFHESVNKKIGYDVSGLRALELIMFLNA
jgi:hypothetical protein